MTTDPDSKYSWCLEHSRVETSDTRCSSSNRLGPYETEGDAQRALETVAERNKKFDAEDEAWGGAPWR